MTKTQKIANCKNETEKIQTTSRRSTQEKILTRFLLSIDQNYKSVLFTSKIVSVYRFENEWIEMGIEGPLYVYKRNEDQENRLIVLNKKGLNDFKLNIPMHFHLEIENQFAIFSHTDRKNIFGFWFEKNEVAEEFIKILENRKEYQENRKV